MGTRTYTFSIPLSKEETYNLLLQAGEGLPQSSDLASLKFGRWENSIADLEAGQLEWKMYDHKIVTAKIHVMLEDNGDSQTDSTFKVTLLAQILDPMGAYKETLRLLLDPFLALIKGKRK